jgi:hypothetical protein
MSKTVKTDNIWLGWTPRESGKKGFRDTNGDHGHAFGKYQFDYRYALVGFMKYCSEFSARYSGFSKYINYGVGSSKLVNNKGLATLWSYYCEKYPEEFEALQDTYAYNNYYLEVKKYLMSECKINLDDHHPVVRGSAFSMAIRSGSLSAARKFKGCRNNMSDETILRNTYATYGQADAKRWTRENQLGDALMALKYDTYTVITIDKDTVKTKLVNQIPPSSVIESSNSVVFKEVQYRVGTGWKDGKCVNQHGCFTVLNNAKNDADKAKREKKKTYYVFDDKGNKVYTSKYDDTDTIYRVGTAWIHDQCINQVGAYTVLSNAKASAIAFTKQKKKKYNVYDNNGTVVFSGKL